MYHNMMTDKRILTLKKKKKKQTNAFSRKTWEEEQSRPKEKYINMQNTVANMEQNPSFDYRSDGA